MNKQLFWEVMSTGGNKRQVEWRRWFGNMGGPRAIVSVVLCVLVRRLVSEHRPEGGENVGSWTAEGHQCS